jgi:hypothetical protein
MFSPKFGVLLLLTASVSVVTVVSQHALAAELSGNLGGFLELEEAVEVENTTTSGATNQTTNNGNTTDVQFLVIQSAQSGSL